MGGRPATDKDSGAPPRCRTADAGQGCDIAEPPKLRRHPHLWLLPRIWQLRHNLTASQAAYVALAEALDAPLVTRGRRLAASFGHRARIELI